MPGPHHRGHPPAAATCQRPQRLRTGTTALEPFQRITRATGSHLLFCHHARKGRLTPDGDGVLGSTAILGGVDTAILVRRNERCRSLWTTQRYGDDLEETVFDLVEPSRVPRLAGIRSQFEGGRVEEAILAALRDAQDPVTEPELGKGVPGRTQYKRLALRRLVQRGAVGRLGTGTRGDPYRYSLPEARTGDEGGSDSCSLVPIRVREQETSNGEPPSFEPADSVSCSLVPAPAGEQGNENHQDPGEVSEQAAVEPDRSSTNSEGRP
jgi:hypothetical protein